jgi:ribosomal protein S27E
MNPTPHIVCSCSEVIVKSHNGSVKLRSKILIFKGNDAYAVCKKCGTEVAVPVSFDKSVGSLPPLLLHT